MHPAAGVFYRLDLNLFPYVCLFIETPLLVLYHTKPVATWRLHDTPVPNSFHFPCTQAFQSFNFLFHIIGFDIKMYSALMGYLL